MIDLLSPLRRGTVTLSLSLNVTSFLFATGLFIYSLNLRGCFIYDVGARKSCATISLSLSPQLSFLPLGTFSPLRLVPRRHPRVTPPRTSLSEMGLIANKGRQEVRRGYGLRYWSRWRGGAVDMATGGTIDMMAEGGAREMEM